MTKVGRRATMELLAAASVAPIAACTPERRELRAPPTSAGRGELERAEDEMSEDATNETPTGEDPILSARPLGFLWRTEDPFLFCAHHDDRFPAGTPEFGPTTSLAGRQLGNDFEVKDGFRMYHGRVVPGFPRHPHRGFETVTVVRRGLLDHADSMGAAARYGEGDVQWLTAGKGIQHSEMFPLLRRDAENPLELFQIWLNLPRADKMVEPYFTMMWGESIREHVERDSDGRETRVSVIAGALGDTAGQAPPPNSWAARDESDVAIWTIKMAPFARFSLPAARAGTNRNLYLHQGHGVSVAGRSLPPRHQFRVQAEVPLTLVNGDAESEFLLLQGRPIGEPVAHHGPFVMNSRAELQRAYVDYHRTQFGGWPWDRDDPVHGGELERFARHRDGREERPTPGVEPG